MTSLQQSGLTRKPYWLVSINFIISFMAYMDHNEGKYILNFEFFRCQILKLELIDVPEYFKSIKVCIFKFSLFKRVKHNIYHFFLIISEFQTQKHECPKKPHFTVHKDAPRHQKIVPSL